MSAPLVWLPFPIDDLPQGLRYEVADHADAAPTYLDEIEFYVMPYRFLADDSSLLSRMPKLRVVQTQTAGVEHLSGRIPAGITLCNGRGIHSAATAELAVALVLASLRGIPGFVRAQDRQEWLQRFYPSLADKHVLIVGFGDIGAAIEARLLPFEVTLDKVARTARGDVRAMADLPELVPQADIVILTVPLTADTRHLVDAKFLASMKDDALLVNVARGGVVDTDALIAELRTRRISAALDVTDPEPPPPGHALWTAPNLLLSPHVGGPTSAFRPRAERLIRQQLTRFAAGEPLQNVMDVTPVTTARTDEGPS
ncbi:2-hydroxyacid dehydrogenase [Streptomyces dysideae]|uniref:Dihydrofolate reductase n=1 Tax=Streptomyces dysideae TaxID=909626 RepID=A0A101UT52_9ACTN|nr:2-hydroxyacid dehydrogenase [Streptomyces dysideae]KUO16409.1 dihydrofolate reductase [Streptomyces dysideae]